MPEPIRPLPANCAFVLQLQAGAAGSEVRHAGRVEHLTSGRAARFQGEDELWAFVDEVLIEVAERAQRRSARSRTPEEGHQDRYPRVAPAAVQGASTDE